MHHWRCLKFYIYIWGIVYGIEEALLPLALEYLKTGTMQIYNMHGVRVLCRHNRVNVFGEESFLFLGFVGCI